MWPARRSADFRLRQRRMHAAGVAGRDRRGAVRGRSRDRGSEPRMPDRRLSRRDRDQAEPRRNATRHGMHDRATGRCRGGRPPVVRRDRRRNGPDHVGSRRHDARATRDCAGELMPTHAKAVYDITGAGDIVMAVFGLCLASGVGAADAARLGNVAAGLEVERAGVDVIYRHEIHAELLDGPGGTAARSSTSSRPRSWPRNIAGAAKKSCSPTAASTCCMSAT